MLQRSRANPTQRQRRIRRGVGGGPQRRLSAKCVDVLDTGTAVCGRSQHLDGDLLLVEHTSVDLAVGDLDLVAWDPFDHDDVVVPKP